MSHNTALVREFIDAINRDGWDAALKGTATGFEVDLSRAVGPVHGVFGPAEIGRVWAEFSEAWESAQIEAEELTDAGSEVIGTWALFVRGRDGLEVQSRVTWLVTVRDGAIARLTMFQERRDAFEAAGLDPA